MVAAGVELANIFQDVGVSDSVPVSDRPGWTELDAKLIRGDTLTVAALDRISRNRLDLVGVVESIKRRIAVGIRRAAVEGRYHGRPRALTPEQTAAVRLLRRSGQSQSEIARPFGVSRQSIWRAEQSE